MGANSCFSGQASLRHDPKADKNFVRGHDEVLLVPFAGAGRREKGNHNYNVFSYKFHVLFCVVWHRQLPCSETEAAFRPKLLCFNVEAS